MLTCTVSSDVDILCSKVDLSGEFSSCWVDRTVFDMITSPEIMEDIIFWSDVLGKLDSEAVWVTEGFVAIACEFSTAPDDIILLVLTLSVIANVDDGWTTFTVLRADVWTMVAMTTDDDVDEGTMSTPTDKGLIVVSRDTSVCDLNIIVDKMSER